MITGFIRGNLCCALVWKSRLIIDKCHWRTLFVSFWVCTVASPVAVEGASYCPTMGPPFWSLPCIQCLRLPSFPPLPRTIVVPKESTKDWTKIHSQSNPFEAPLSFILWLALLKTNDRMSHTNAKTIPPIPFDGDTVPSTPCRTTTKARQITSLLSSWL